MLKAAQVAQHLLVKGEKGILPQVPAKEMEKKRKESVKLESSSERDVAVARLVLTMKLNWDCLGRSSRETARFRFRLGSYEQRETTKEIRNQFM